MKDLWYLFWAFARIGCFTFGGGYAMLPMLQKEIVEKYHWASEEEIMNYFAVGQCTPGVIAVNTATFIGYKQRKIIGGITATLGVIFPSLIIITLIASLLENFSSYPIVQHAFAGIRIVVASLILNVVIKMYHTAVGKDLLCFFIFISSLLIGLLSDLSPIYFIVVAGALGVLSKALERKKNL